MAKEADPGAVPDSGLTPLFLAASVLGPRGVRNTFFRRECPRRKGISLDRYTDPLVKLHQTLSSDVQTPHY